MIWWALLFFACGMLLILAEFIVPGGVVRLFWRSSADRQRKYWAYMRRRTMRFW